MDLNAEIVKKVRYRCADVAGGTYFFTANLVERKRRLLAENVDTLPTVIKKVKAMHPFHIDAMVVLPDRLLASWTSPEGIKGSGIKVGIKGSGIKGSEPMPVS